MWLASARSKVELYEGVLDILVQFHDCPAVSTAEAVVWRREDGHALLVMVPLVALHGKLVGTRNHEKPVVLYEGLRHILTKGIPCSSG